MKSGDYEEIARIVPKSTMDYLLSEQGKELARRMQQA